MTAVGLDLADVDETSQYCDCMRRCGGHQCAFLMVSRGGCGRSCSLALAADPCSIAAEESIDNVKRGCPFLQHHTTIPRFKPHLPATHCACTKISHVYSRDCISNNDRLDASSRLLIPPRVANRIISLRESCDGISSRDAPAIAT